MTRESDDLVDAVELLDRRDREREALEQVKERVTGTVAAPGAEPEITGQRGAVDLKAVRSPSARGARAFVTILVIIALGIAVFLGFKAYALQKSTRTDGKGAEPAHRIEKAVPSLKLERIPARGAPVVGGENHPGVLASAVGTEDRAQQAVVQPSELAPHEAAGETSAQPGLPTPQAQAWPQGQSEPQRETVQDRRLARGFGGTAANEGGLAPAGAPGGAGGEQPAGPAGTPRSGSVAEKLEPTELAAASATVMKDRDFAVTRGTMLDCVLETKTVSTVPGLVSCYLTRDVYGTNGRVKLMDRGGKLTGSYQTEMQQGEARVFVTWGRLENPNGVVVNLDSPGTGPLGESGVGGWTDTHFLDRFGAAMLVSIIGGVTDAGAARLAGPARGASLTLNDAASATKQAVNKTFDATINMPPTLYVNQGERIGVFVARDLSFHSVYGLELAGDGDE